MLYNFPVIEKISALTKIYLVIHFHFHIPNKIYLRATGASTSSAANNNKMTLEATDEEEGSAGDTENMKNMGVNSRLR